MGYEKEREQDVVMWVRLPKPASVKELRAMGLRGADCYSGDTCIAATSFDAGADIVLQPNLGTALKRADLLRDDPCFGGDTCIV